MLSEELRTVAAKKKSCAAWSAYMVLRQSRKCEKTLSEAVIQKHNSNGNAVEVCLNHTSQWGYYVEILEATKSCGYVMFRIFIQ